MARDNELDFFRSADAGVDDFKRGVDCVGRVCIGAAGARVAARRAVDTRGIAGAAGRRDAGDYAGAVFDDRKIIRRRRCDSCAARACGNWADFAAALSFPSPRDGTVLRGRPKETRLHLRSMHRSELALGFTLLAR